jgi:hypothetical protein
MWSGEKYGEGDIVGCRVDQERRLFFTKNGRYLGKLPFTYLSTSCARIGTNIY